MLFYLVDFLAKYCIFNKEKYDQFKAVFQQVGNIEFQPPKVENLSYHLFYMSCFFFLKKTLIAVIKVFMHKLSDISLYQQDIFY